MKRLILAGAALTIAFLSVSDVGAGGVVGRTQTPPAAPPHAGVRATINIDPLRVVLKLKGMTARAGTTVSATETVANASKSRLTKVTATIELERNLAVWPEHPQAIGVLGARTTQTVRWTLCARAPGTYTVVAQATGQDAAGHQFVAYSGIEILVITGGAGKCTRSSAPDPRSIIQGQSTPRPWLIAAFSPRTTTATCLFSGWAPHMTDATRFVVAARLSGWRHRLVSRHRRCDARCEIGAGALITRRGSGTTSASEVLTGTPRRKEIAR